MKFAILGMGKIGHSMTAYLMGRGHQVTVWDRQASKRTIISNQGITITGVLEGLFRPEVASSIPDVIQEAEVIIVATTASGHRPIAEMLAGHLKKGQIILICNGNWGVYEFRQVLGNELVEKHVDVLETGGMHLMTDSEKTGVCRLKRIKDVLTVSSFPKDHIDVDLARIHDVFPQFKAVSTPLMTSLNASNPVLHGPIGLFEFSTIENGGDYFFYKEGATHHVVAYIERIDKERLAVMQALGLKGQSCLDIVNAAWQTHEDNLYDAIHLNYPTSKGPKSVEYRFFTEDVPFGLAPICKLGKLLGIPTPYTDTLVDMYSKILDRDFFAESPILNINEVKALC